MLPEVLIVRGCRGRRWWYCLPPSCRAVPAAALPRLARANPPPPGALSLLRSPRSPRQNEFEIFSTVMLPGSYGVMTHFWCVSASAQCAAPVPPSHNPRVRASPPPPCRVTAGAGILDDAIFRWVHHHESCVATAAAARLNLFINHSPARIHQRGRRRYYIDGESEASIEFTPSMMSGVGFDDPQAPWGTKWFGKGAKDGAWFHNFKIPFQKAIRITAQRPSGTAGGFYCIVRGVPNVPINLGGVLIPGGARLVQVWLRLRLAVASP